MILIHDTPAGALVYDAAPELAFDPAVGRELHRARCIPDREHAGRPGTTASPFAGSTAKPVTGPVKSGFGGVVARSMLTPTALRPWLTPELAAQELAIGEYQADRVQCALDSIA